LSTFLNRGASHGSPTARSASTATAGAVYALLAYASWGLTPIYWKALAAVPPVEVLGHRVVGTALFTALLLTVSRRWHEVAAVLRQRRQLAALLGSALLIASNWGVFIWAVQNGQITATSLGYYLTPLANVALGLLLLRERLSRLQGLAVAIAAVGVASFAISLGRLPWISLFLALSFASYGWIRKTVAAASLAGLAVETALLAPIALAGIVSLEVRGLGALGHAEQLGAARMALLLGAGIVTAVPLVWFASAARRLRLVTLGLFQYLAPSLSLALAVFAYGEPFTRAHALTFACIWAALALYSFESVRAFRTLVPPPPAPPTLEPATPPLEPATPPRAPGG
jgi:chloramphenicol-sensitive protein RarD